jgi:hypothetical protein
MTLLLSQTYGVEWQDEWIRMWKEEVVAYFCLEWLWIIPKGFKSAGAPNATEAKHLSGDLLASSVKDSNHVE